MFAFGGEWIASSESFESESARLRKEISRYVRSNQENLSEKTGQLETVVQVGNAELRAIMLADQSAGNDG